MFHIVGLVKTKLVDTIEVRDVFVEGFFSSIMTLMMFNAFHAVPEQLGLKARSGHRPVSNISVFFLQALNVLFMSVTIQMAMSLFVSRHTTGIGMETCDVYSHTVPILLWLAATFGVSEEEPR